MTSAEGQIALILKNNYVSFSIPKWVNNRAISLFCHPQFPNSVGAKTISISTSIPNHPQRWLLYQRPLQLPMLQKVPAIAASSSSPLPLPITSTIIARSSLYVQLFLVLPHHLVRIMSLPGEESPEMVRGFPSHFALPHPPSLSPVTLPLHRLPHHWIRTMIRKRRLRMRPTRSILGLGESLRLGDIRRLTLFM